MGDQLSCLMVTYPSTTGCTGTIKEVCDIVHQYGGQVYLDGANMNAQVGLTRQASIGCGRLPPQPAQDLRRHSPRRWRSRYGPIGVKKHHSTVCGPVAVVKTTRRAVTTAPCLPPVRLGHILPISWMYIAMLGDEG